MRISYLYALIKRIINLYRGLQDRLAAAAKRQQEKAVLQKRQKVDDKLGTTTGASTYLQQKGELEAKEGKDKGDDSSKWYVR